MVFAAGGFYFSIVGDIVDIIPRINRMKTLIGQLVEEGYLKSGLAIKAFLKMDRREFIPKDAVSQAASNRVIPIGFGQTNSEPKVVAFMLELLEVRPGHLILDVGSGSGWTTSLLGEIVGRAGKVVGVEVVKELKETGERNAEKFGLVSQGIVEFFHCDGRKGLDRYPAYDRILVSAEAEKIPGAFLRQLKTGGVMVIPVNKSIWRIEKQEDNSLKMDEYKGFRFVPLIET